MRLYLGIRPLFSPWIIRSVQNKYWTIIGLCSSGLIRGSYPVSVQESVNSK